MSEARFTKGPWKTDVDDVVSSSDGAAVALVCRRTDVTANAKLISAAPDMYEALLQIQEWLLEKGPLVDDGITHPLFIKANNLTQAALAKAAH